MQSSKCDKCLSLSTNKTILQISVIPDDLEVISKEVADFSKRYTYVITTGGVGPTHDDLTFEGTIVLHCKL